MKNLFVFLGEKTCFNVSTLFVIIFTINLGGGTINAQQDNTKSPKIQWDFALNRTDAQNANGIDWIFEVITATNGNYVGAGYSNADITGVGPYTVPSACILSPKGEKIAERVFDFGDETKYGSFADVIETSDGYVFIGRKDDASGVLAIGFVKTNKTDLTPIVGPLIIHAASGSQDRASAICEIPNNGGYIIIGSTYPSGGTNWDIMVMKINTSGTVTGTKTVGGNYDDFGTDGQITEVSGTTYKIIYTGERQMTATTQVTGTNADMTSVTGDKKNKNILVGKLNQNLVVDFTTNFNGATIMSTYPKTFTEYGPGTPNWTDDYGCNSNIINQGFTNNSYDVGYRILRSNDGSITVGCYLNWLLIPEGGTNSNLHRDVGGVECIGKHWHEYRDADAYLIKVNYTTGVLENGKHVGHFSGGDFHFSLQQESDGDYVIAASTADKSFPDGLPDVVGLEDNFIIKTNASFAVQWRRHFLGQGDANCTFGLDKTPDGGYIVVGNNEDDGENYSFIKLAPDCQLYETYDIDQATDYPITGAVTWSANKKIRAQVVVKNGGTLTINNGAIIRFAYSRYNYDYFTLNTGGGNRCGITVEKGGKLYIIGNAIVKGLNTCTSEEMYDGINSDGDPSVFHNPVSNNPFIYLSSATVENAVEGLVADKKYFGYNETLITTTGPGSTNWLNRRSSYFSTGLDGGARIHATSSTFLNCRVDVSFGKYDLFANGSYFQNCTFRCNSALMDEGYTDNSGRRLGTKQFISLWAVRNVRFMGCQVFGNNSFDWDLRGIGMVSFDANYHAWTVSTTNKMLFQDLDVGVEADGSIGGLYNSVLFHDDFTYGSNGFNFKNCRQNMNLRNSALDQIYGIEISEISSPQGLSYPAYGMYGVNAKGFWIADNSLNSTDKTITPRYGIIINNSYLDGGEEFANHFNTININSQFEQNNDNIIARCNDYTNVYQAWNNISGTMAQQGLPNNGAQKADNKFIDVCISGTGYYSDIGSNGVTYTYYDKAGNVYHADLYCVDPDVTLDPGAGDFTGTDCEIIYPCTNCYASLLNQYNASNKALKERNALLRFLLHQYAADTTTGNWAGLDSAINILKFRNQQADKRLLAATYTAKGDWNKALNWLNKCDSTGTANSLWKQYYKTIITAGQAGRDVYHLTESEYSTIRTIAGSMPYLIAYAAQSLLYQAKEEYYPLVPERIAPRLMETETEQDALYSLKAYPNPFNRSVAFEYSFSQEGKGSIEVFDLLGRKVLDVTLNEQKGKFEWQPGTIKGGIYIYRLIWNSNVIEENKLVYIN